jgi:hypothetical protein
MLVVMWHSYTNLHRAFAPALALGFGTASSAATMPVTMQNAEDFGAESSIVRSSCPWEPTSTGGISNMQQIFIFSRVTLTEWSREKRKRCALQIVIGFHHRSFVAFEMVINRLNGPFELGRGPFWLDLNTSVCAWVVIWKP